MEFVVQSRRWKHPDPYIIEREENGWFIHCLAFADHCNKKGESTLYEILDNDCVHYPKRFGNYLEYLWEKSEGKDEDWIQDKLNDLSRWINIIEASTPDSKFWNF